MNFGLSKDDRLRKSNEISRLFESKKTIKEFPFILYYDLFPGQSGLVQIAFGSNRNKIGNAFKRNKIKRIMREAYRLNKNLIQKSDFLDGHKLALMLICTSEKLPTSIEAEEKIKLLLIRLIKILKA